MRNHVLFASLLLSLASSAQMIDLAKNKIILDNKEITMSQLDSLMKYYPSFSLKTDNSTNPPTAYVKLNSKEEVDSMRKAEMSQAQVWLGSPMPSFSVRDIENNLINTESLRGKIVVMNFYFTSCTPCIREIPELNKLVKEYNGKNVVFLAFALNNKEQLNDFLSKKSFHYKQVADVKDVIEKNFKITSWPTHFIFDETGIAHYQSQGFKETTISEMNSILKQLVK